MPVKRVLLYVRSCRTSPQRQTAQPSEVKASAVQEEERTLNPKAKESPGARAVRVRTALHVQSVTRGPQQVSQASRLLLLLPSVGA